MASSKRRRGAPTKFRTTDISKIRAAYGTSGGRGRRSSTGATLQQLAEAWGASVATIRHVIHGSGAYAS